jgi:hypothetical protein
MMKTAEEMLKEYEEADSNKRLHMFLQYRDLRHSFQEIENKALTDPMGSNEFRRKSTLKTYLSPAYAFLERAYSGLCWKVCEVVLSSTGKDSARSQIETRNHGPL